MTSIQDAQNSTQKTANQPVVAASSTPGVDNPTRTNQQRMLPTGVQSRLVSADFISNLITNSNTNSVSGILRDGSTTRVTAILTNNNGLEVLGVPDMSVYIGISNIDQISSNNEWPTTSVNMNNFPVSFNPSDYGLSDGNNQVATINIANFSGTDYPILIVVRWRIITQGDSDN